jgi:antibiotic biosynthesis monooxygenase (ABM) superfamily enzyme
MKPTRKVIFAATAAALLFSAGYLTAANKYNKPNSIIHIVNAKWKADATDAQKKAAIAGVEKMAAAIPGMKNLWMNQVRKQPQDAPYDAGWVIEFESREAERAYEKSPARTEWFEKVYNPIREESFSNQYTNQ